MYVLGVNLGHDSGAALVSEGRILAATAEERFVRIKHAVTWPLNSLDYCLKAGGISIQDVDLVAVAAGWGWLPSLYSFFGKDKHPRAKELYLRTYTDDRPPSVFTRLFRRLIYEIYHPSTLSLPLYADVYRLREGTDVVLVDHHLAHAACAYYTSGFNDKCLFFTCDGIGDGVATAVWLGEQGKLRPLLRIGMEGSLGFAYGLVTEALGWQVNEGEGKTMGLAPYGSTRTTEGLLDFLFPQYRNGSLASGHDFSGQSLWVVTSNYHSHFLETNKVKELVDQYGREHIAAEAQRQLEVQMLELVLPWVEKEGLRRVAASGGVFLNVKMNQRLLESGKLEDFHIYPDAGDGGTAAGAALYAWYQRNGHHPIPKMRDAYFGPEYAQETIKAILEERNLPYQYCPDIVEEVCQLLVQNKIVGWFQGRMEVGPRALGSRSILIDPRRRENKDIINQRVKFREPFRPFCPSLPVEAMGEYLVGAREAPFMVISFDTSQERAASIPAVVHVDNTCRPQTVSREQNEKFWRLLHRFGEATGVPVLLNTSYNIKGEPITCSPRDALKCFYDTGLDYLALGDFLLSKKG